MLSDDFFKTSVVCVSQFLYHTYSHMLFFLDLDVSQVLYIIKKTANVMRQSWICKHITSFKFLGVTGLRIYFLYSVGRRSDLATDYCICAEVKRFPMPHLGED
jgi:hypothetical protein